MKIQMAVGLSIFVCVLYFILTLYLFLLVLSLPAAVRCALRLEIATLLPSFILNLIQIPNHACSGQTSTANYNQTANNFTQRKGVQITP
jgi:hypothetical protein